MLPPFKLQVPVGTKSLYITAISLCKTTSQVAVNWSESGAIFGATFAGPNDQYVLSDNVFNLPVIAINESIPVELMVSFNFNDDMRHQHSVSQPTTSLVGPEGNATQVQISGYASSDQKREFPTIVTILFQRPLHADPQQNEAQA